MKALKSVMGCNLAQYGSPTTRLHFDDYNINIYTVYWDTARTAKGVESQTQLIVAVAIYIDQL